MLPQSGGPPPTLASGSLLWRVVKSLPLVVSPLLLQLLQQQLLLHGGDPLAGLSMPSLGGFDVRVQ